MAGWFGARAVGGVLLAAIRNAGHFRPDEQARHVGLIDYNRLRQKGIKAVIFDKDNCLTRPYCDRLVFPEALAGCIAVFGGKNVAVLSNDMGCGDVAGADRFEKQNNVRVIRHRLKKPFCSHSIRPYFADCVSFAEMAMIGDRICTDVLMARQNGMYSILVDPITNRGDGAAVSLMRYLERTIWL